jgi:hypothetical protein
MPTVLQCVLLPHSSAFRRTQLLLQRYQQSTLRNFTYVVRTFYAWTPVLGTIS